MVIELWRTDLHFDTNATSPELCRIVLLPTLRISDGVHRVIHNIALCPRWFRSLGAGAPRTTG